MKTKEDIAREILTEQLLEDFKSEITGEHQARVVGVNPEEAFFVGKLMSINDEEGKNKVFSSKTFIESISVDFYISEKDVNDAIITIYPRGDFYYRAYPTLEEQRRALLKNVYETTNVMYKTYEDLSDAYAKDPKKFINTEIKLIPVYKKLSLTEKRFSMSVKIKDILQEESGYGYIDARSDANQVLAEFIDHLMEDIQNEEDFYRFVVNEKTEIKHLSSEGIFKNFVNTNAKRDVKVNQNWNIYVELTAKRIKDKYLISVSLVNNSRLSSNTSLKKANDKKSIETMFNAGLMVRLGGATYEDIEMDYFADDYKYDRTQKAIGTNCTVVFDKTENVILTEHLPIYIQYRFVTNDKLAVKFDDLLQKPQLELHRIEKQMQVELEGWRAYKASKWDKLTDKGKQSIDSEIREFGLEIQRFQKGIKTIENYPIVKKSFVYMNETFKNTNKKYST